MSEGEPHDTDRAAGTDESLLARWSRRKAQSRAEPAAAAPTVAAPTSPTPAPVPPTGGAPPTEAPVAAVPAIELPDLDLLGEDSDYSAFLTPGVDADLRRRALRKLFASPKFNAFDGLDTYRGDYTSFPALGTVVTTDMRHHVERLARKAAQALDEQSAPVAPIGPAAPPGTTEPQAPTIATVATNGAEGPATPEHPADARLAPGPEEKHDSPV